MQIEDRLAYTKRAIVQERRNRHILKAEWKALTTPERIQRLSEKYLRVVQIEPEQLREYDPAIFHPEEKSKKSMKLSKLISEIMTQRENEERQEENGQ